MIDFLTQALDCFYEAEAAGVAPPHEVRVSVFSGASAGAISAALAAAYFASDQPPIATEADARARRGENRLFDSWVERVDIEPLLGKRDLAAKKKPVVSLLDSTVLDEIADAGLRVQPRAQRRPWLADDFQLVLTVTNLRGVPYGFEVTGEKSETHDMALHADYVHFRLSDDGADGAPDRYCIAWREFGADTPGVQRLKAAALASGAFPVGLAPRALEHVLPENGAPDYYSARTWPKPTPFSEPHQCVTEAPIPARFGKLAPGGRYAFQCVDGGVMNNEPLELARKLLSGNGRNKRAGVEADRAVLLIDPFPGGAAFDAAYAPAPDLLNVVVRLFAALKNQARFKAEELLLALDDEVYSRFMIAPSRSGAAHPIASAALYGFGGFLQRGFRAHDWFLGRRNAQKFLRQHLVLPEGNPLFSAWSEEMKAVHASDRGGRGGERLLPVIPLLGAAAVECAKPAWPRYGEAELEALTARIEKRVELVVDRLVEQYFDTNNFFVRLVAGWVLARKKKDIVARARETVAGDLRRMGLLA